MAKKYKPNPISWVCPYCDKSVPFEAGQYFNAKIIRTETGPLNIYAHKECWLSAERKNK